MYIPHPGKWSVWAATVAAALMVTTLTTPAWAQHDIGTQGYFRIGAGFSGHAEERACFQAPGADWKFRLGNECDTWIEGGIHDNWTPKGEEGPHIFTQVWLGTSIAEGRWNAFRFHNFTQMYIQVSNLEQIGRGTKVWAGRKYYQRHDIHINDFYWSEMLGDGFGVEDIDLGVGKLMYAYTRSNSSYDDMAAGGTSEAFQNNHDLRLTDIALGQSAGKLTVQLLFAHSGGTEVGGQPFAVATQGFEVGAWHEGSFGDVWNKVSFQYCGGLMRWKCRAWNDDAARTTTDDLAGDLLGANMIRFTEQFLFSPSDQIALFGAFVFQKEDGADYDNRDLTWYAFGLRPMYFFNENVRALAELSVDRTENGETDLEGNVFKGTLAGELSTDFGFWNRPVLRAFVSVAHWSDSFRGQVGGAGDGAPTDCSTKTTCFNAGVQAEYWW
ncbi:carbohydrate porin [Haliangium sp.]|uniref:carbohydrate porin n=1 Tax=Haliangium sp. TaxID=2663208 RepID=UPI003D128AA5